MKKNNGITLIALVITIIVMLILVAVTINLAINGRLFDYATKATTETKDALESEKSLVDFDIQDAVKHLRLEPLPGLNS